MVTIVVVVIVRRREGAGTSAAALAASAALAAALMTVAVGVVPFARYSYESLALRVMLETVNAVIALFVGYLAYGRFRERRRLQDLLLGLALCTAAAAALVLVAVPSVVALEQGAATNSWAALGVRLAGAMTLVAAALVPRVRPVQRPHGAVISGVLALVLAGLGVGVTRAVAGGSLPPAVDLSGRADSSVTLFTAHPAALGVLAAEALLYALAAGAFARQAEARRDQLLRWLAAGCVLSAFARLHYLLYPSLYSDTVYTGDVLRLGFYILLLVGAAKELTAYWRTRAEVAVLEDRRRVARDLHDGVIQELSYIWAQYRRLSAHPGDAATVERIGGAAGRAIEESRRTLAALTRPEDQHLPTALRATAEAMSERYDVKVVVDSDPAAETDGPLTTALLRITGEAVHNAVRHGEASRIVVRLTATPLALSITDDGRGFPTELPTRGRPEGFGLTSMRERAAGVGGTLAVESRPGEGTTVRVSWP